MDEIVYKYGLADVLDTLFAVDLDREARANRTTPRGVILEVAGDTPDSRAHAQELQGRYNAGRLVLDGDPSIILVSSGRFRAPAGEGQVERARFHAGHDLTSPAILVPAGHIATSRAYRWVGLARRR